MQDSIFLVFYATACSCEAANKNVDPSAVNPVCDADGDCICQDASKIYVPGSGCIVGSEWQSFFLKNFIGSLTTIFTIIILTNN